MRSVNTHKGHHATLLGIALALMFTGAALRAQQPEQQEHAMPAQQVEHQEQATPTQQAQQQEHAPPDLTQDQQPPANLSHAQEKQSPLDQLDDLEPPAKVSQAPPAPTETESLHVLVGRPLVVTSPTCIRRVSVADPGIIDAVVLSRNQFLINGKGLGRVSLVVWDATGQSQEFDINVDCDAPILPDQLLATLPDQPAGVEVQEEKMSWSVWVVIASIILVGGAIVGTRWQRGHRLYKLELQEQADDIPDAGHGTEVAVVPHEEPAEDCPAEEAITHGPTGVKLASPSPKPGNADRNERLLEAYLEAAAKGMSPTGPNAGRDGLPCGPKPSGAGPRAAPPSAMQRQPLLDTITALAFAVDAKGPYTTGHSQAVSRLSARTAIQAGLSAPEVEQTRLAGLVHDIGKIHVPESVCNKPDLLTAEEFEIMRSHSAWGAEILEPLNVKAIERIVRHHHERYDGKGYPDGLAADKIPLGARIVAVAECFHNMLSDLPYKSAHTFEDALAELRRCSGRQFDPMVVTAFLDWIQTHSVVPTQE
jgi:putative nucleotidyltransferase with HDIG domain